MVRVVLMVLVADSLAVVDAMVVSVGNDVRRGAVGASVVAAV